MNNEELYQLAANAVRRKKYSDATEYFLKILSTDPEHIDARKGLRLVQNKEFKGKKFAARLSGLGLSMKIKMAMKKKDYDKGILACESYLCKDPTDVNTHYMLAQLAKEAGYVKTATFAYETMVSLDPDDADRVIEAADYLSDLGISEAYDKANQMMSSLLSHYPDDTDLRSDQSRIAAKKVTRKFESAESSADLFADQISASELEAEGQQLQTDADVAKAIQRAERRVEENEDNPRHREVLADLYFRSGQYLKAKECYEKAIELDPNNQLSQNRYSDVKIMMLHKQVEAIRKKAISATGAMLDELKRKLKMGEKKLVNLRMQEYSKRIKVNPNDLKTRFSLGELFYSVGEIDRAIQQFQRSSSDSTLAFKSAQYLGLCFKSKRLYDMAIKEFMEAAQKPTASLTDRLGVQNEAGDCFLELKQVDKALEIYKKILEKDYAFKDVAKKVEQLSS